MSVDEILKKLLELRSEVGDVSFVKARIKGTTEEVVFRVVDVFQGVSEDPQTFVMLELKP